MVGDAQVPLLRIVPVAGRDREMVARAFDHIQYCPLAQRRFQGRVVVTLHCRKKKTYSGMKPPYRSDRKYLQDYYLRQAGHGYPVYTGGRFQRGNGLGSIFGGLFKAAMPLLKSGAKTLDREALKTGLSIAGDVVQR
jgi:hypothetical protein